MTRNRRRTTFLAAALMATTVLLTACQDEGDGGTGASGSGSSAAASRAEGAPKTEGASQGAGTSGGGADAAGTKASAGNGPAGGKGVSGTWFGNVSYLAPGKYTVSDTKGTEQAFFTAQDTDIEGAGVICGDADGQAATPCGEEELEAAAKKGVSATVKIEKGIAVSVVEDHSSSSAGGADAGAGKPAGLHSGELGYLAPGKYSLDENGSTLAFFTTTETTVNGNGWICGEEGGASKHCSESDLTAAARKGGVRVVVDLDKGTAVTIDEEHN
jgi:hypothetical protein